MNRGKKLLCLLLCGMLCCGMLASCGKKKPLPEESSLHEASSEESAPEKTNDEESKKIADQLLSAFFAGELSAVRGDGTREWIDPERVQEIREQVKTIGKPFLTEETVWQIARTAADFYMEAEQIEYGFILPGYDAVEGIYFAPSSEVWYTEHEARYNALLAYTLYLFTPPKYAFSEGEVGLYAAIDVIPRETALSCVYLALAGEYVTWRDALTALQARTQGVILYASGFVPGVSAPNFEACYSSCALLRSDLADRTLDLSDWGNPFFESMLAGEELAEWLWFFTSGFYTNGYYEDTPKGIVHVLLDPDTALGIRNLKERVTRPILTEDDVHALLKYVYNDLDSGDVVLLPGVDGAGDVLTDPIGVDIRGVRLRVLAYLVDLFTPPDYRFTDLTRIRGTYYALKGEYRTRSEALAAFEDGEMFLLYTEDGDLYLINGFQYTRPLVSSEPYWQGDQG